MKPHPLDRLLPLLESASPELHRNAAVLEVADSALLAELAANPKIGRYLPARLSDVAALIEPGCAEELAKALLQAGYTPKRVKGVTA